RREVLVGVPDPDDGYLFPPRLVDQAADIRDDRIALVRPGDGAVLHIDHEERGVRPVVEGGHGGPFTDGWLFRAPTLDRPADNRPGRANPSGQPVERCPARAPA